MLELSLALRMRAGRDCMTRPPEPTWRAGGKCGTPGLAAETRALAAEAEVQLLREQLQRLQSGELTIPQSPHTGTMRPLRNFVSGPVFTAPGRRRSRSPVCH